MEEVLDAGEGMTRGVSYSFVLSSTGNDRCAYQWWLGDFFHSQAPYLETEDFIMGRYKWKLRLFPRVDHYGQSFISINLVSLNSAAVTVELMVTAINHRNAQYNHVSGGRFTLQTNQDEGFPCFQDLATVCDPNAGFLSGGRYVLEAAITVVPVETDSIVRRPAESSEQSERMINLTIFEDRHIKEQRAPMHPFAMPFRVDGVDHLVSASIDVGTLYVQVCELLDYEGGDFFLWICDRASDGSLRPQIPLDANSASVAVPIGSFCDFGEGVNQGQLTLYVADNSDWKVERFDSNTWMLFLKIMDPGERVLTYQESITVDKRMTCDEFGDMLRHHAKMGDGVAMDLFIQDQDLVPKLLELSVDRSVAQSGLCDKEVIIACMRIEDEPVAIGALTEWLTQNFEKDMQSLIESNQQAAPSNSQQNSGSNAGEQSCTEENLLDLSVENELQAMDLASEIPEEEEEEPDEELCCICWDKPRTSGFLHADERAHLCACQECAEAIMKADNPRCPLCNQDVVHVIKHYH